MSRSIPGTTILSDVDNELGHLMLGTVESVGAGLPTTAATFGIGAQIIDRSTSFTWNNIGTSTVPIWSLDNSSGTADPQMMKLATVTLTAAQMILATAGNLSHANGLIVVPAAPTGYVNILHRMTVSYTFATAAFTGGGNTTVNIGGGGAALTGLIATTSLWQSASSVVYEFKPLSTVATPMTAAQSINLVTASAITNPGTAAGSCKIYCWYSQVAI